MRLAIAKAAAHQRARTRRVAWIKCVNIEGHAIAGASPLRDRKRLIHAHVESALVNLAHSEKPHAKPANQFALSRIDVARAHMRLHFRIEISRKASTAQQFTPSVT